MTTSINREKFLGVFDETIDGDELLESYETYAKAFLPKLQNNNFPIYGLIGEYGTGKSTFLNAVQHYDKLDTNTRNIRITFEARKYPNRKELRDAFIIEILSQVIAHITNSGSENSLFETMDEIKKKMLGGKYTGDDEIKSKWNSFKESAGDLFKNGGDAISSASSMQESGNVEQVGLLSIGVLAKFVGNCFSGSVSKMKESVSRIFDYEYFFAQHRIQLVQQHYGQFNKVYIVIEDIDRCGEDGLVFLETLSYFMNTVSKLKHNMDKMTCIVSIGQGFLKDHRHLINKAITSYEMFLMKTESIQSHFSNQFLNPELGLSDKQKTYLLSFLNSYLDLYGKQTRTVREIKYLFKKVIPEMVMKKQRLMDKGIDILDDVVFGMILYNFSLFIRSNKVKKEGSISLADEVFDSMKALYYCKSRSDGSYYLPHIDTFHKGEILGINIQQDVDFLLCCSSSESNVIDMIKAKVNSVIYISEDDKYRKNGITIQKMYPGPGSSQRSPCVHIYVSSYRLLDS